MFEWIKFIGEFILGILSGLPDLLRMMVDAVFTVTAAMNYAPNFLTPILGLMIAVVCIMWVVNIF